MHTSSLLLVALCAVGALAAPSYPQFDARSAPKGSIDTMSKYWDTLASKVQQSKSLSSAPPCDLSQAVLPIASPTPLPRPSTGLTLKHVAIGRGVQNYTCASGNASAAPLNIGALATLFNASYIAAAYPDLLATLPSVALQFNLTPDATAPRTALLAATDLAVSGHHMFLNTTTPFFNLDAQPAMQLGLAPCAKNNTVSAPAGSAVGQQGERAIAWLKLLAREGATGQLEEVYRVNTAGGSAPPTCAGMPAAFSVQYAAEYWFYMR